MAVTGQTLTERAADEGTISDVETTDVIRINDDVITVGDLAVALAAILQTVVDNAITAQSDVLPGLAVSAVDNSPAVPVIQSLRGDGELIGFFHTAWLSTAVGLAVALNCLDARLWITTDDTEPVGASNGQYWIYPRPV